MMDAPEISKAPITFPAKLMGISMLLTLAVVILMGSNSAYIHYFLTHDMSSSQQLAEQADDILYLDSVLTQSVKTGNTGDTDFDKRYREALELELNDKIGKLPPELGEIAHSAKQAGEHIALMDEQYRELLGQNKSKEAAAILGRPDYKKDGETNLEGRRNLSEKVREASHQNLLSLENNIYMTLAAAAAAILALCTTWYFALRSIRDWRRELEFARTLLIERLAEKERLEKQMKAYITQVEVAQRDAVMARDVAEKASVAKSDFLANMSHEIRTPMNAVLGMSELLTDTELNHEQRTWIDIIRKSGEGLLDIINDILDFSKIEAGKLRLEPINFDMGEVMMEIADLVSLRIQEKGLEFILHVAPDLPLNVIGDPVRLRQVILNLVGNAIKFTEKGCIVVRASWEEESKQYIRVYFEVQDSGIGIPTDKLKYVFDKFSQAEESTTRRFGGTGLGLTICRKLVEMMGGSIDVQSVLGQGSTFRFSIFLQRGKQAKTLVPAVDLTGLRALVMDNTVLNCEILVEYLKTWGMRYDVCTTAQEAMRLLQKAFQDGIPYHFALVDYRIGEENALHIADWIKKSPAKLDPTLFMFTSLNRVVTSTSLSEKGFSGLFVKPFLPSQLKAALQIIWDAKQHNKKLGLVTRHTTNQMLHPSDKAESIAVDMFPGINVLVAEDMKVNLLLITRILEKHGCTVHWAENGAKAVQKALESSFDIVFMDCQMPEMDGFEAARRIRKEEASTGQHTPIIALTADAMVGDREKCLQSGMDDYLNKPFRQEQITKMLREWVRKAH